MTIRNYVIAAATFVAAVSAIAPAHAVTIDFEDRGSDEAITTQYAAQGVTFSNAFALRGFASDSTYASHSGTAIIYGPDAPITITFKGLVSNISAFAGNPYFGLTLSAFGSNGALLGTSSIGGIPGTTQFIGVAANNIASATFSGVPDYFALDDISFDVMTSAAPEPGTWAMMILGFGLAGVAMRRRIKVSEVNFTKKVRSIAAG